MVMLQLKFYMYIPNRVEEGTKGGGITNSLAVQIPYLDRVSELGL